MKETLEVISYFKTHCAVLTVEHLNAKQYISCLITKCWLIYTHFVKCNCQRGKKCPMNSQPLKITLHISFLFLYQR